ncbi:hypothetical protein M405DRAFT_823479 [Rhizopogon salebrosus TDB-379]|nr:hypothetical protein M405DRAFT_823479 [Rhizopogon salebrosus TDB-379]
MYLEQNYAVRALKPYIGEYKSALARQLKFYLKFSPLSPQPSPCLYTICFIVTLAASSHILDDARQPGPPPLPDFPSLS